MSENSQESSAFLKQPCNRWLADRGAAKTQVCTRKDHKDGTGISRDKSLLLLSQKQQATFRVGLTPILR